jgi:hypothetical protein
MEHSATRVHLYFNRFTSSRIPGKHLLPTGKIGKLCTFASEFYLSTLEEEEEEAGEEEKVAQ